MAQRRDVFQPGASNSDVLSGRRIVTDALVGLTHLLPYLAPGSAGAAANEMASLDELHYGAGLASTRTDYWTARAAELYDHITRRLRSG